MTVLVRPKRGQVGFRRRLRARGRSADARPTGDARRDETTQWAPGRDPRDAVPPQDEAVYSCSCGMVFEAPVSTSVDCPHCGGVQAW